MTISLYNPMADANYATTMDLIRIALKKAQKEAIKMGQIKRAPKAVLNFGNKKHAFMVLWNPDKIERDYWQVSVNAFGINFVYFGL